MEYDDSIPVINTLSPSLETSDVQLLHYKKWCDCYIVGPPFLTMRERPEVKHTYYRVSETDFQINKQW